MIYYLFLAWDNKVVIRAGAFIFCVGNQLSRLSERREGKALTQDSEVGVWAGALFLCLRTGSRVRRLTLGKNFFPMVIRPAPPGPAKAPLTVGANHRPTPTDIRETRRESFDSG